MYDPNIGRWLSEDPVGLLPDENPYRYVHNSPVNFTDPSGLAEEDDKVGQLAGTATVNGNDTPQEVKDLIKILLKNPKFVDFLKQKAKETGDGNERGGTICGDKKGELSIIEQDPAFGGDGIFNIKWHGNPDTPIGSLPEGGTPDNRKPIIGLRIKYLWHTHPSSGDAWPSPEDCKTDDKWNAVEIVVHYKESLENGELVPRYHFHIVGPDGRYWEWTPPELIIEDTFEVDKPLHEGK